MTTDYDYRLKDSSPEKRATHSKLCQTFIMVVQSGLADTQWLFAVLSRRSLIATTGLSALFGAR